MTDDGPKVVSRQATLTLWFGSLTAALLLVLLAQDLRANLRSQWREGSDRAAEVAYSVAQMAHGPLRSSSNAMLLIAEESRRLQQAGKRDDVLLNEIVAAVLRRQPQIVHATFADTTAPAGTSTSFHPNDGTWTACDTNIDAAIAIPCFGTPQKTSLGWVLPIASSIDEHQWVVGAIRIAALERAVAHAPDADEVSFSLVDTHGRSILHSGPDLSTAAAEAAPPGWVARWLGAPPPGSLQATAPIGPYPFSVTTQIGREDVLTPWRHHVMVAVSFYLLYLAAFVCLQKIMARTAHIQQHFVRSLQAKTEALRLAQRAGRTAMWTLSDHARHFECQEDASELLGLPSGHATISVKDMLDAVAPADRWLLLRQTRRAWKKHNPLNVEFRIRQPGRAMRCLLASGQVVIDEAGTKRMTGTAVDVTEQWSARQRQVESEHRFDVLFEQNPLPFWVFDASSLQFLEINAAAIRTYGYSREEFLAMTILDIRDPSDRLKVQEEVALAPEARFIPKVWVHRTKNGAAIDVRVHTADIVFADRPARLVLAEDVTTQLADERELSYRASHDLVTGLPNQHAMIEWMDVLIAGGSPFEVAYVQLLGMDAIADTFGINIATGILQMVAARLAERSDGNGYLASVTQQAFVWVTSSPMTEATLQSFADCVAEPIYYKDTQHQISIMIGVARHPQDGMQSDTLLARAALAAHVHLHSDKPIHYFEAVLAQQSREKLHFSACLRRAVKRHEFELHFQLITDFPDRRPIGLEALIRWPQTDGSIILPSTFIPICEEAGLIVPLGNWVLSQAAKASRELKMAGFANLPISINVSPAELRSRDLVANIRAAREAYSLASDALRVELTESCLIEHKDKAIAVMKQLRADGVAVALDDFGTGFSSLSYLRDLPIDTLKIDQAFVRNVDRDERSATICEAIIALGKSLKVNTIAEGIEREAQFRWLQLHGCDAAQGFYIGRPERLADVLKSLSQYKAKAL
ncbi:putative bifunctional diguanylate cyclase/phosphodiesterase [Dyella flagellata]|uniref:PAS domain S-box-containing protein n=1 Tax=Dyella flagellata TaxID=1867833 RepID=A0ABQ5X9U8_9GAMM|nr:EAL domain-containing protein [Dyella flagellata]GLQ88383.1 hypothetical protein GCM10007898_19520 [Dyella flagellata]